MTVIRETLRYHAAASRVYADTWMVVDIFTGLPIVVGGIVMDGLSDERVNELVDELNYEDLVCATSCGLTPDHDPVLQILFDHLRIAAWGCRRPRPLSRSDGCNLAALGLHGPGINCRRRRSHPRGHGRIRKARNGGTLGRQCVVPCRRHGLRVAARLAGLWSSVDVPPRRQAYSEPNQRNVEQAQKTARASFVVVMQISVSVPTAFIAGAIIHCKAHGSRPTAPPAVHNRFYEITAARFRDQSEYISKFAIKTRRSPTCSGQEPANIGPYPNGDNTDACTYENRFQDTHDLPRRHNRRMSSAYLPVLRSELTTMVKAAIFVLELALSALSQIGSAQPPIKA